ncbi:MAG: N-acetyltransferase [Pseudomonadota bacterium]
MTLVTPQASHAAAITALFARTFTASEGAEAGAAIEALVHAMLRDVPAADLRVFAEVAGPDVTAAILFSRMTYSDDPRQVFILSPVAVAPEAQGQGLGQRLITYGLNALRAEGVDVALTYGAPAFYAKTGFAQITEDIAKAPQPLQYPHGWLGQSLTQAALTPLQGTPTCAAPLNDPAHW